MAKKLTRSKARKMLHEGTAQGHKLMRYQQKYFAGVASGTINPNRKPRKRKM